ncbi:MAG: hypothetical protein P4M08_12450 [Oligoflexia bacterium]|nr:hypothetical protein [Oligoflexia bacterium]
MVVGFMLTAMMTIPPMIALKFFDADVGLIVLFPFVEFLFVGTFILFYCRIFWLHLEYAMTDRLDGH